MSSSSKTKRNFEAKGRSSRPRARFGGGKETSADKRRKPDRLDRSRRKKNDIYSRKLKVIPTSKIVEKLYDGNGIEPPPLPQPSRIRQQTSSQKGSEERTNSFAWQPTEFTGESKNLGLENLEYFMEGDSGQGGHEFDELFKEEAAEDEFTYDHYYESSAYTPDRKNKSRRMCTSCQDEARMCKMDGCLIS
mmetsp:Transcript_22985/g.32118  ORF Transcript_22985/g.32118 Transcript_22985/m.32118 type:complete len:191 (-) Transcript_22985:421-993(-)|eukprot:CAMPEP_0184500974 /NCGR_PEP_ID=MMETSP0113_2-20130426/46366_1 /TAXON_ID=91329 /ORGANISM="Norrisiella sphaerica, Strain BC52" /LENGTH=190 /DNA_ID=CAMNT_0026889571 /DNA_START=272 /DNA_END=844 /DNA_ORIENTATION=+